MRKFFIIAEDLKNITLEDFINKDIEFSSNVRFEHIWQDDRASSGKLFGLMFYENDQDELIRKAKLYDEMIESRRKGAAKANTISAEARTARAKKAAKARWSK